MIFLIEYKIKIIFQSMYMEIIGNQKWNGESPNLRSNPIIIIKLIKYKFWIKVYLDIRGINFKNEAIACVKKYKTIIFLFFMNKVK